MNFPINKVFDRLKKISRRMMSPRFRLISGAWHGPTIESNCVFQSTSRITLGADVRFLRGAMVFADSKGEISIGDRSAICRYAVIQAAGGNISIGSHTIIGDFCSLYGQGGLIIGDKVMIASGCRIIPNQHTFENIDLPIIDQHCKSSGISIQDGVWMGSNAIVLDGVHIGQGAIIGAGSVVTHSIPAFSIAVGVPARVIRTRPGHVLRS